MDLPKKIVDTVFSSEEIIADLNKGILQFRDHVQEYNKKNNILFDVLLKKVKAIILEVFQNAEVI